MDSPSLFDGHGDDEGERKDLRLANQITRVFAAMSDGQWHSMYAIAQKAHAPESSVGARLRDLRKPRFGGHTVERKLVTDTGLYDYRLIPNGPLLDGKGARSPKADARRRLRALLDASKRNAHPPPDAPLARWLHRRPPALGHRHRGDAEMINPTDMDAEIIRLSEMLEERVEDFAQASSAAAEAEAHYKFRFARTMLDVINNASGKMTVQEREAKVDVAVQQEHRDFLTTREAAKSCANRSTPSAPRSRRCARWPPTSARSEVRRDRQADRTAGPGGDRTHRTTRARQR